MRHGSRALGSALLLVLALVVPASIIHGSRAGTSAAMIWRKTASLSPPLPATHSEWSDGIRRIGADGSGRFHAFWENYPVWTYRWSDEGSTWSAPEPAPIYPMDMWVTPSGEISIVDGLVRLAHRDVSGNWTTDAFVSQGIWNETKVTGTPDGTVWVVYTDETESSARRLYARSKDPSTGTWSALETIDTLGYASLGGIAAGSDGTLWVSYGSDSWTDPFNIRVARRTGGTWTIEQAATDGALPNALIEQSPGEVVLTYWTSLASAGDGYRLRWTRRTAAGAWSAGAVMRGTDVSKFSTVLLERDPSGTVVAAWNECVWELPGRCYPLVSRLAQGSTQWTSPKLIGSYPRAEHNLSLALRPDGRAVLTGVRNFSGGWIAREDPIGTWSDQVAPGPAKQVSGSPYVFGLEVSDGPSDSLLVAWEQNTGDGLGVSDAARTPHIGFGIRDHAGGWSALEAVDTGTPWRPWRITNDSYYNVEPDLIGLAGNGSGEAYVIWREFEAEVSDQGMTVRDVFRARHRDADGTWDLQETPPFTWDLSGRFGASESRPRMVFDSQGALWLMSPFGQEWYRAPSGAWTQGPSVLPQSTLALHPRYAIAADGTHLVAWRQGVGDIGIYVSRRGSTDTEWSVPQRIDRVSTNVYNRELGALAVHGDQVVLAWAEDIDNTVRDSRVATVSVYTPPTGTWSAPAAIRTDRHLQIADARAFTDGTFWLVWTQCPIAPDGFQRCDGERMADGVNFGEGSAVWGMLRTPSKAWTYQPLPISTKIEPSIDPGTNHAVLTGPRLPTVSWWDPEPGGKWLTRLGPRGGYAAVGAESTIEVVTPSTPPQAGTTATVEVVMKEVDGTPLADRQVTWQVSGTGALTGSQGATDAAGHATAQIYSTKTGTTTVTVSSTQGVGSGVGAFAWAPGPATAVRMSPASTSGAAGSTVSVKATLSDAYGNGIPGAPVAWTIESGPGQIMSSGTTTDSSGVATASVRSTQVGTMRLAASSAGFTGRSTIYWQAGAPKRITLTPVSDTRPAMSLGSLIAQVTDDYGNPAPVSQLLIRWEWTGQGILAGFEPLTDASGAARAQPFSPFPGAQVVTATLASTGAKAESRIEWT